MITQPADDLHHTSNSQVGRLVGYCTCKLNSCTPCDTNVSLHTMDIRLATTGIVQGSEDPRP